MIINLSKISEEDFFKILRNEVTDAIETGDEVVLNFLDMKILTFEKIRSLVLQEIMCQIKGKSLRMINIPDIIKKQLIMIGIQCWNDEVIIK